MMMRALGHVPDLDEHVEEDLRSRHVGSLVGAAAPALPLEIDYSPEVDLVSDQETDERCVGSAFASSIYILAKLQGAPIQRPSEKGIWDVARLIDSPNKLENVGCRPRAAIDGMLEYGIASEARWPSNPSVTNELPPMDVFRAGCGALLGNHYRIGSGAGSSLLVQIALSKRFLVPYSQPVDDSYLQYDGSSVWRGLIGPVRGYHMQVVVGYMVIDGRLVFIVLGSWGLRFGRRGYALIDAEFFESGQTRDMLVPTVIPSKVA